jgi:hypothetical protein
MPNTYLAALLNVRDGSDLLLCLICWFPNDNADRCLDDAEFQCYYNNGKCDTTIGPDGDCVCKPG